MLKNEQETIGYVIEHLLAQGLDHVIVADNLSTDRTRDVLDGLIARGLPVTVVEDNEVAFFQGVKMTRLADLARSAGAEWVVPFDADELWVPVDPALTLRKVLQASGDADVLVADWYDHVPTIAPAFGRTCFRRMRRRDVQPSPLTKVAFRALPGLALAQGNHGVTGMPDLREIPGRILVHHYRWRSLGHFIGKNRNGYAAYQAGGDAMNKDWGREWLRYGRRGRLHLTLTYLNLIRCQFKKGTVSDPVEPGQLSSS